MRTQPAVLVSLLLSAAVVACGGAPAQDDEHTESSSLALRRVGVDTSDVPVNDDPPPPPEPCKSSRFDLYRNTVDCQMPPSAAGGAWSKEPLFPNAPVSVRNRFCAYTWQPSGMTPACAAAPSGAIPRAVSEQLGARGHCPLSNPACRPTLVGNTDDSTLPGQVGPLSGEVLAFDQPSQGTTPPITGGLSTFLVMGKTTGTGTARSAKPSTNPAPVNPGGLTTVVPIGSAGCCDACAEIANRYTFVVLPSNQSYSSVYFDVSYQTPSGYATETVTVNRPPTNVIQVGLRPNRQYVPGMIWAIHHTL